MTKRYQHILVPLDGSPLAELALADAFALAELSRAEVTLLQVIPPIDHVIATESEYPIFVDQQWEAKRLEVVDYMHSVCERLGCPDVAVHPVVEMGLAAETIIDYARHNPIDLIVMATHGRSGLQRWVYGSVADKVLRGANQPILLVRAYPDQQTTTG